ERITAAGVEVNAVDDVGAFADLMRPVWERFVRTPAQQRLLDDIRNMAGGADA
ncbi:MAG TPA: C4-dicarboxylate ABC transporter, partial [Oceanicaulis sp.]|nr:C4-dicarboxylate ABC transporter [Oceanicaulis sp.]